MVLLLNCFGLREIERIRGVKRIWVCKGNKGNKGRGNEIGVFITLHHCNIISLKAAVIATVDC